MQLTEVDKEQRTRTGHGQLKTFEREREKKHQDELLLYILRV